ncbi:MAG: alpha/beta hydrolase-fold protein [Salipiger thiooxidans]|uniref:alpha/beta hydrolase-fold protein n=1 Tax=Salipiger thiooxidans TaxID=282683 RepID=UPI001CFA0592|nr:alpha/beta hydrolase-fold protein [Salipiger thiooxidans]
MSTSTGTGRIWWACGTTLDLVTEALVPPVQHRLPVDPAHRMILGHSFGGASALEARTRQAGARTGRRAARRSGAI